MVFLQQMLPLSGSVRWTPSRVRSALDLHDQGCLQSSAQLFDAMTRDDSVQAAVQVLCKGIIALPKVYNGPDADFLKDTLQLILPDSLLFRIMRDALGMGIGFAKTSEDCVPESWWPGFMRYDWISRQWLARTSIGETEIDDDWIVFAPTGQMSWLDGVVRSIGLPWLIRQDAFSDWAKWSESYSRGVKKVTYPERTDKGNVDRFVASARTLGSNPVVACPRDEANNGFDIDIMWPPSGGSADGFERLMTKCETKIAISILGQHLTTEASGAGGYGAATVHANVKADIITFWAKSLSHAIAPYIQRKMLAMGKDASLEFNSAETSYPALLSMGQGMVSMSAVGVVDVRALAIKLGLPVKDIATTTEPVAITDVDPEADPEALPV